MCAIPNSRGTANPKHWGTESVLWGTFCVTPSTSQAMCQQQQSTEGNKVSGPTRIWLILPAVICFVQGLSHACLSAIGIPQRVCEWLLTSAVIYVIRTPGLALLPRVTGGTQCCVDILQNLVANTRKRTSRSAILRGGSDRARLVSRLAFVKNSPLVG